MYTKEAETADQYIEKVAHEIGRKYLVTVATSDGTEQVIIRGQGCHLLSAKELKEEVEFANKELRQYYSEDTSLERNYCFNIWIKIQPGKWKMFDWESIFQGTKKEKIIQLLDK